jgi:hypothetical protein
MSSETNRRDNHDSPGGDSAPAYFEWAARSPPQSFGANHAGFFGGSIAPSGRSHQQRMHEPVVTGAEAMLLPAYSDVVRAESGAKFGGNANFGGNNDVHLRLAIGSRHLSLQQHEVFGANDPADFNSGVIPCSPASSANNSHAETPGVSGVNMGIFPGKMLVEDQNVMLKYLAMKKQRLSELTRENAEVTRENEEVAHQRYAQECFREDRHDSDGAAAETYAETVADMSNLSLPTEDEVCMYMYMYVCTCACTFVFRLAELCGIYCEYVEFVASC